MDTNWMVSYVNKSYPDVCSLYTEPQKKRFKVVYSIVL